MLDIEIGWCAVEIGALPRHRRHRQAVLDRDVADPQRFEQFGSIGHGESFWL